MREEEVDHDVVEDNGGDSKGVVEACVEDEGGTCILQPRGVHPEGGGVDPAAVESEEAGMGNLQPQVNVHMVGALEDDAHMGGDDDDVTSLLDYRDRLAIGSAASVVDLAKCPLIASFVPAARRLE